MISSCSNVRRVIFAYCAAIGNVVLRRFDELFRVSCGFGPFPRNRITFVESRRNPGIPAGRNSERRMELCGFLPPYSLIDLGCARPSRRGFNFGVLGRDGTITAFSISFFLLSVYSSLYFSWPGGLFTFSLSEISELRLFFSFSFLNFGTVRFIIHSAIATVKGNFEIRSSFGGN